MAAESAVCEPQFAAQSAMKLLRAVPLLNREADPPAPAGLASARCLVRSMVNDAVDRGQGIQLPLHSSSPTELLSSARGIGGGAALGVDPGSPPAYAAKHARA